MQKAYSFALKAVEAGEVPVGAVIVAGNNELIGTGFNQVITKTDPSAHAEILAIREAATNLANYRLLECTLYVTLEPCAMCAAALVQARIKRLVYATRDLKAGAAGSVYNLLAGYPLNHRIQIDEGIMQEECSLLLQRFFLTRRQVRD